MIVTPSTSVHDNCKGDGRNGAKFCEFLTNELYKATYLLKRTILAFSLDCSH